MVRKNDENYLSFCEQVTTQAIEGKITYSEWCDSILDMKLYGEENLRRCALFFNHFMKKLDTEEEKILNDKQRMASLQEIKDEIVKERKKLQEENREYQASIRQKARVELLDEKILEAIQKLTPMQNHVVDNFTLPTNTTGVLVVSDIHYDSNYTLNGLYGEIVNEYNKTIAKARMNKLIDMIACDEITYDDILVVFNGDLIENVLRMSSLVKLREPVVDSVIELSEFLSNWLVDLQGALQVPIKVAFVGGNHSIIRALGSKPIDERENFEKIIHKFVELRLKNQDNIKIEPYTDAYFATVQGNNILFVHGEDSDLSVTMDYYENYLNVTIDYIVAGHYHRGETKTVGVGNMGDREIIRVPSICGTDDYAKRLRKNARAGAMFMTFTEEGRSWSRNYCLN